MTALSIWPELRNHIWMTTWRKSVLYRLPIFSDSSSTSNKNPLTLPTKPAPLISFCITSWPHFKRIFRNIQIRREFKSTGILQRRHEWFPPGALLALKTLIKDEEREPNTQIPVQRFPTETLPGDILDLSLPDTALLLNPQNKGNFPPSEKNQPEWIRVHLCPAVGMVPKMRNTSGTELEPAQAAS